MTSHFIEVRNLVKAYGSTVAVNGVSLSLPEGKTGAIIGSSGCGKSTLLRCLNLLEQPTAGSMRIGTHTLEFKQGETPPSEKAALPFRRQMAMVFQSFDLFPHLSALRNVALAPTLVNGVSRGESDERAMALLDRVGLKHKADAYPAQLSGGQMQRVAIARALAMQPQVLLFDEATSALDPELVGEVLQVIKELSREGRTMLVVTHELAFARDVADTLYFFDGGRVAESGNPREIMARPQTERLGAFLNRFKREVEA